MGHVPLVTKLPSHRKTAVELAALAWTEGLKFCHLGYGGNGCKEPCDACYQTALSRLIVEARRMRQHADQSKTAARIRL